MPELRSPGKGFPVEITFKLEACPEVGTEASQ